MGAESQSNTVVDPLNQSPSQQLKELLVSRYSCRAFSDDPVPRPLIEELLEMSQRTASWCNTQPWEVAVTSGESTEAFRGTLYEAAVTTEMKSDIPPPRGFNGVYLDRRRESGYALYNSVGIERHDRPARRTQELENYRLFGAPHVAVITTDKELGEYGYIDCGGYISTFLIAAQSLGISAVPQAAVAMYSDVVREFFKFDDSRIVVAGISFGYADADAPINGYRTTRSSLEDVVTWC